MGSKRVKYDLNTRQELFLYLEKKIDNVSYSNKVKILRAIRDDLGIDALNQNPQGCRVILNDISDKTLRLLITIIESESIIE